MQKVKGDSSTYVAGMEKESEAEEEEGELEKRCEELMRSDNVVLFMKGDRDTPRYVHSLIFSGASSAGRGGRRKNGADEIS